MDIFQKYNNITNQQKIVYIPQLFGQTIRPLPSCYQLGEYAKYAKSGTYQIVMTGLNQEFYQNWKLIK